jgi:uncharacterized damage-inducible protein DinB
MLPQTLGAGLLEVAVRLIAFLVLATPLVSTPVAAQEFKPSPNPVSDSVRQVLVQQAKHLVDSAELMPADKYGYHPTEAQMTFGKLVAHIVQTNTLICSAIDSMPASADVMKMADTAPKDTLVGAIKQSFTLCTEALAKVSDAQLGEEVSMMGRRTGMSRAAAMITIANDWADHYSTAASYLRLNGILPPSAQPKK